MDKVELRECFKGIERRFAALLSRPSTESRGFQESNPTSGASMGIPLLLKLAQSRPSPLVFWLGVEAGAGRAGVDSSSGGGCDEAARDGHQDRLSAWSERVLAQWRLHTFIIRTKLTVRRYWH